MRESLTFDDVLIQPLFSTVSSRKECSTRSQLNNISLGLPILSSNMDTITESEMANAMTTEGGLGALHRFMTIEQNVEMFKKSKSGSFVSIGLGDKELDRARALSDAGAINFIIDVANGASMAVVRQYIDLYALTKAKHIMVGNFATGVSIKEFIYYVDSQTHGTVPPPDSFKVGIGGGSMCSTRIVTGCGMPTLESVIDCATTGYDIIADGGIRNSGDIAKCLAAGAKAVMVGSLLSGTNETPGEIVEQAEYYPQTTGQSGEIGKINKYKKYRGSASKESYEVQGKLATHRAPEGVSTLVPYKGPVGPILQELSAGIKSAMSYVDARTLEEFRENAKLIRMTSNGIKESVPHGKK